MRETYEQKTLRLMEEKAILVKAFASPGVQLIFTKLKDSAKLSLYDYDNCDFDTERGREMAHRIQARRYVILTELPKIIDEIINVDIPLENGKKAWRFNAWLDKIKDNISRFFIP